MRITLASTVWRTLRWRWLVRVGPVRRALDRRFVGRRYVAYMKRPLELEPPRSLSHKVTWRILYGHDPLHSLLTDRLELRKWVDARLGPGWLPQLLASGSSVDELGLERLEQPCVLKTTHGNLGHVIVRDPARLDLALARKKLERGLSADHYRRYREFHYHSILPRVMAEELLRHADGRLPDDFKFHVFGGHVALLEVHVDRHGDHRIGFYGTDWQLLPDRAWRPAPDRYRLPANIGEMAQVAGRLGQGIDYVRVDLYNVDGRIVVGELTFTPAAGQVFEFAPRLDEELGALWPWRR